jgi:hypothetical protein
MQIDKRIIGSGLAMIVTLATIIGIAFAVDTRYAKEITVVETLQQFQMQQQATIDRYQLKNDYKFYKFMYDDLTKEMYFYRKLMREHPNDAEIKLEHDQVVEKRKQTGDKMNAIMEQLK